MRTRTAKFGAATAVALIAASAVLWLAGPERPRAASIEDAPLADGPGAEDARGSAHSRTEVQRRELRADAPSDAETAARQARAPFDVARTEVELRALLEHLLRLDELRDLRGVERAIEEFLQRWGGEPGFGDALLDWLWRADPPPRAGERAALALIARCWLASALSGGLYAPADAQRFALELVQRAVGAEDESGLLLLASVLGQSDDGPAPQLRSLAMLGSALLAHLEPGVASERTRAALLELLEDWGAREPLASSLLKGLLADPRSAVRTCAYRALLRADLANLEAVRDALRAEGPELFRSVASWLVQRRDGLGFDALRQLVEGLDAQHLGALRAASLARDFALGPARLDPAAFELAWSSLRSDESALGRELRDGLLQGLGLAQPTAEQVELLRSSSFDPRLRRSALQALAIADPAGAALRVRELALSTALAEREDAISTSGNLLARDDPPPELLDALLALLDDARIHPMTRDQLAEELARHRSASIEDWRRRTGR